MCWLALTLIICRWAFVMMTFSLESVWSYILNNYNFFSPHTKFRFGSNSRVIGKSGVVKAANPVPNTKFEVSDFFHNYYEYFIIHVHVYNLSDIMEVCSILYIFLSGDLSQVTDKTLSHNVVSRTPCHEWGSNSQL
jgi:hypothetical protein